MKENAEDILNALNKCLLSLKQEKEETDRVVYLSNKQYKKYKEKRKNKKNNGISDDVLAQSVIYEEIVQQGK